MKSIFGLISTVLSSAIAWLVRPDYVVSRRGEIKIYLCLMFLAILAPEPAFAYVDPGSGAFILQAIIGAIAAGAVALKMFWHRILSMFGKRENKISSESPADPPQENS